MKGIVFVVATMVMTAAPDASCQAQVKPRAVAGKQVFGQWCSACHAPGRRFPGTAALAAKYGKDMPAALEARTDMDADTIKYFVRHGISVMPSFRKTEISDKELDALAAYLSRKAKK